MELQRVTMKDMCRVQQLHLHAVVSVSECIWQQIRKCYVNYNYILYTVGLFVLLAYVLQNRNF